MLSYFVTQVNEDMWSIMRADSRDSRSDFIFPKRVPTSLLKPGYK